MSANIEKIKGTINLPSGNYYAVWSGYEVKVWDGSIYRCAETETGLRGMVNCLVKIDQGGKGIVIS